MIEKLPNSDKIYSTRRLQIIFGLRINPYATQYSFPTNFLEIYTKFINLKNNREFINKKSLQNKAEKKNVRRGKLFLFPFNTILNRILQLLV